MYVSSRGGVIIFTLTVSFFTSTKIFSQLPGGVESPAYWFVSDKKHWVEQVSNTRPFTLQRSDTLNINFHQSLYFDGQPRCASKLNLGHEQTIITVLYPEYKDPANTNVPTKPEFFSLQYHNKDHIKAGYNYMRKSRTSEDMQTGPGFPSFELNGTSRTLANAFRVATYTNSTIGCQNPAWGCDNDSLVVGFKGYIPEFLIYDRKLDLKTKEKERIESWLAMKYGITIELFRGSYYGSDGEIILAQQDLNLFGHRICAIGKDTYSGFWQQRSNTSHEQINHAYSSQSNGNTAWTQNRSITIGFTDPAPAAVPDRQFLFWGDDDEPVETLVTRPVSNSSVQTVSRNWAVYNRHSLKNKLQVEVSGYLKAILLRGQIRKVLTLLKLDGTIDKEDFLPLHGLPGKPGVFYNDTLVLRTELDSFTVGVVDSLRQLHRTTRRNQIAGGILMRKVADPAERDTVTEIDMSRYIPRRLVFNRTTNQSIPFYEFHGQGFTPIGAIVYIMQNNQLEFYMRGGLAPFTFTLEVAGQQPRKFENIPFNPQGIYTIASVPVNNYRLTITDFSNQRLVITITR